MTNPRSELNRIEAFSDGVFAIAITLLILEIKVPHLSGAEGPGMLLRKLIGLWPSYLAFLLSFGSILVMWVNHHETLRLLNKSSKALMFANGFLLLTITFIPFPTAVLAEYINTPHIRDAVVFYSFSCLINNVGFNIWGYTMLKPVSLYDTALISKKEAATLLTYPMYGFIVYVINLLISWFWPVAGFIMLIVLYIFWSIFSILQKYQQKLAAGETTVT